MNMQPAWLVNDFGFTNKELQYSNSYLLYLTTDNQYTGNQPFTAGKRSFFEPNRIDGKRITAAEVIVNSGYLFDNKYTGIQTGNLQFLTVTFFDTKNQQRILNMPLSDLWTANNNGRIKVFDFDINLKMSYASCTLIGSTFNPNVCIPFNFYFQED